MKDVTFADEDRTCAGGRCLPHHFLLWCVRRVLDAGLPLPDYTVGVSAGIAYGVSYLSRQNRRNLKLLTTYANDKRYMGVGNFLDRRNRSYFGLKFS